MDENLDERNFDRGGNSNDCTSDSRGRLLWGHATKML